MSQAASYVFLLATMLGIGLTVTGQDILLTLENRSLLLRSLAANLVLVPIVGLLVTAAIPLAADTKVGILLLAAAPGGLAAIQFTSKVKEGVSFAVSLLFILSVAAILITPLTAKVILAIETPLSLPYLRAIRALALYLLLPLCSGFAVQRISAKVARALSTPVALLGTLSFVAMIILTMATKKQAMRDIGMNGVAAMFVVILASMVIGWALGGPDTGTRRVLATGTSIRNAALCLVIAFNDFPNTNVDVAVVAFSSLMVPPNMLFTIYEIVRSKRAEKP